MRLSQGLTCSLSDLVLKNMHVHLSLFDIWLVEMLRLSCISCEVKEFLMLTLNRSFELFPKVLSAVAAKDVIPMPGGTA